MLIGARLNWLLSPARQSWGEAPKKFIQIDIEPKEMDSNVEIVPPSLAISFLWWRCSMGSVAIGRAAGRLDKDAPQA